MPPRALVVDADGHVCEPADLWTTRPPSPLRGHTRDMDDAARAGLFGGNALRLYNLEDAVWRSIC